ncbi:hypothetical protein [Miltoncostaea oceani]|uniref:hypothetical protein n=1 Tax=Miltoncostaea oceani TaxID=2843216 RepID=UPI001C3DF562|nr:hypothetical protein [Miltoncostaea oceani]
MLIRRADLDAIADGRVTLAFRRWVRPTVRAGGTLRTAVGLLAIDAVDVLESDEVTDADARRAGYTGRDAALRDLDRRADGRIHRIVLRPGGPDPRVALRDDADLDPAEADALRARLAAMDGRSGRGPWTAMFLRTIDAHPGVRAADLAASLGLETPVLKRDVRKLKALGPTESLEVGYRLSRRGRVVSRLLSDPGSVA